MGALSQLASEIAKLVLPDAVAPRMVINVLLCGLTFKGVPF